MLSFASALGLRHSAEPPEPGAAAGERGREEYSGGSRSGVGVAVGCPGPWDGEQSLRAEDGRCRGHQTWQGCRARGGGHQQSRWKLPSDRGGEGKKQPRPRHCNRKGHFLRQGASQALHTQESTVSSPGSHPPQKHRGQGGWLPALRDPWKQCTVLDAGCGPSWRHQLLSVLVLGYLQGTPPPHLCALVTGSTSHPVTPAAAEKQGRGAQSGGRQVLDKRSVGGLWCHQEGQPWALGVAVGM